MRKKIIMACYQFWDSPAHVGSHHFAKAFVKSGWDVLFLSAPISPLHLMKKTGSLFDSRFRNFKAGGEVYLDGHLTAYVRGTFLPPSSYPILKSPFILRNWWRFSIPNVLSKIAHFGFNNVDLIYFDNPQFAFLLNHVQTKASVYRIADKHSGFPGYSPALFDAEKNLAQSVDLVVYAAANLREHCESLKPKRSMHLPNGVDFQHFQSEDKDEPLEYKNIPQPIVVYVGAIEKWFDFKLVNFLAEKFKNVSFVFIGPDHLAKQNLKRDNIFLLGSKPFKELPTYLKFAKAGIIPFDVENYPDLIHSVNPLKLYEYLACGLPVASVEWAELKNLKTPALLAKNRDEFVNNLEKILTTEIDQNELKNFAKNFDWSNRISELQSQIEV